MRRSAILILIVLAAACGSPPQHRADPTAADGPPPATSPSAQPPKEIPTQSSSSPTPTAIRNSPTAPSSPTPAAASIPSSLVGTEWTALPTTKKVVALTFDAGANNAGVDSILHTLGENGVPGTFFLTGKWTELYPDQARRIAESYPVGNHTYDHPYLTTLSDRAVREEVARAGDLIRATTGRGDRPLFRFPYGDSDARTIGLVNDLGYGGIRWTVDTVGWKGTSGGETVDRIVDRVLEALRPGAIVLMHVGSNPDDGSTLDADALPRLIDEIRSSGYGFVTVDRYV